MQIARRIARHARHTWHIAPRFAALALLAVACMLAVGTLTLRPRATRARDLRSAEPSSAAAAPIALGHHDGASRTLPRHAAPLPAAGAPEAAARPHTLASSPPRASTRRDAVSPYDATAPPLRA